MLERKRKNEAVGAASQWLDCLKLARTSVVDPDPDPLVRDTDPDPAHAPDPDPYPSII